MFVIGILRVYIKKTPSFTLRPNPISKAPSTFSSIHTFRSITTVTSLGKLQSTALSPIASAANPKQ